MADYAKTTWVEKVTQTGPTTLNNIEAGIKDAAQDSKQRGAISARPNAAASNKNWFWTDSATGQVTYSDGSKWYPIGGPDAWVSVACVATSNVTLTAPGATIDGYALQANDRVLLAGQTSAADNGLYVWTGAATTLTRCGDASLGTDFTNGRFVGVVNGTLFAGTDWTYTAASSPTLGTTSLTFSAAGYANPQRGTSRPAASSLTKDMVYTDSSTNGTNVCDGTQWNPTQQAEDALQAGLLSGSDCAMSGFSVNAATGAITFTLQDGTMLVGNPLRRAKSPAAGHAVSVTPTTLPTSGNFMSVAVEAVAPSDWNGAGTLTSTSSTNQTSQANALANPAALNTSRVRLCDVVIQNSAGSYLLSTTRDRRPWALGYHRERGVTSTISRTGTVTLASMGGGVLAQRVECSGVAPIQVVLKASQVTGAAANYYAYCAVFLDGAEVANTRVNFSSGGAASVPVPLSIWFPEIAVSGGSHLFDVYWGIAGSGWVMTLGGDQSIGSGNGFVRMLAVEQLRPFSDNGTT